MAATAEKRSQPRKAAAGRTGRKPGEGPASPQYRQARRDRGADTRAQLIEAALDVFGRLGFDGASTREIAKAAGVNLAAIVYHFGSKEGLHQAVAESLVARINALIGPALAGMAAPESVATPEAARAALVRMISTMIDVLLGSAEAERWARFIIREQMQPTAAFDQIYSFMGAAHGLATRLVAKATGRPEDEETQIRVMTLLGQVLVFRIANALVLRRMNWEMIADAERETIRGIVVQNINAIIEGARA